MATPTCRTPRPPRCATSTRFDDVATVTVTGPALRYATRCPTRRSPAASRSGGRPDLLATLAGSMAAGPVPRRGDRRLPGRGAGLGGRRAARHRPRSTAAPPCSSTAATGWSSGSWTRCRWRPTSTAPCWSGTTPRRHYLADDLAPSRSMCAPTRTRSRPWPSAPSQANPEEPENVEVSRPSDALAAKAAAGDAFTSLFLGLGAVALLVGAVGTANVMVMSVLERRGEIGLRRALGATRRPCPHAVPGRSRCCSRSPGDWPGSGSGRRGHLRLRGRKDASSCPLSAVGYGLLAAVVIGVLAGVYPAMRAARLSPTEALRST